MILKIQMLYLMYGAATRVFPDPLRQPKRDVMEDSHE